MKQGLMTLSGLNDDVLLEICDHLIQASLPSGERRPIQSLSLVNRRFCVLTAPLLFRTLKMHCWYLTVWNEARHVLGMIHRSHIRRIATAIRVLDFDICLDHPRQPENSSFPLPPPRKSNRLYDIQRSSRLYDIHNLVNFMADLSNLHTLKIHLSKSHADALERGFQIAESVLPITFPAVTNIMTNLLTTFIIAHCPNVEKIQLRHTMTESHGGPSIPDLGHVLRNSTRLIQLQAMYPWTVEAITTLACVCPQLRKLCLEFVQPTDHENTSEMIAILGDHMKKLQVLGMEKCDPPPVQRNMNSLHVLMERHTSRAAEAWTLIESLDTIQFDECVMVKKVLKNGGFIIEKRVDHWYNINSWNIFT